MHYQIAKREIGAEIIVPSIVNWKANHFSALMRESQQDKFLIQGPISNEDLLVSKATLDSETSGYFLVPDGPLPPGWAHVDEVEAANIWGAGLTTGHNDYATTVLDDKAKQCPTDFGSPPSWGMATYNFHTQTVSLNITDTPVGYTPPRGPDMHFTITYNQRERTDSASHGSVFGLQGNDRWVCNWIAYIQTFSTGSLVVHVPGGGSEPLFYPGSPDRQSGAILTQVSENGYLRTLPDGSQQKFDKRSFSNDRIYMTEWKDPAGHKVLFNYDNDFRLQTVTDDLGQVTHIYHQSDDSQNVGYRVIKKITDPFGRSATFCYHDLNGRLWKITDPMGIVSEFLYDGTTDFVKTLVTPYKTTRFYHPDSLIPDPNDPPQEDNQRVIKAIDDGTNATERVEFAHMAPGISPSASPLPSVPSIAMDNEHYNVRNSFYWDKKASEGAVEGTFDYAKAKVTHWLHQDPQFVSGIKESEKLPLENPVYYFYPGQATGGTGILSVGNSAFPSIVARVLGDDTTQLWGYAYDNLYHKLTSVSDPRGRVTNYIYDPNGIDLIAIAQSNTSGESIALDGSRGDFLFECTYTTSHLPHIVTDAAGQTTTYTYTQQTNQVETVTVNLNGVPETTTYGYGNGTSGKPSGYLTSITSPAVDGHSAIQEFTYDNANRVETIRSLPDDYVLTFHYDDLDRVTLITYPDTTTEEFIYTRLDLTASKDRLGRWTTRHYNADRQMDSITEPGESGNPNARTTNYNWCACGALESIQDANLNVTSFCRDLQGRVHKKKFPDLTTIDYLYDGQTGPNTVGRTSRLVASTDALGQTTNYEYFPDDTLKRLSYTNARVPTPAIDYTYDQFYRRIESVTTGGATNAIDFKYWPITYPPNQNGGHLKSVGGFIRDPSNAANVYDTVSYLLYDERGRVISQSINGVAQDSEYDPLGRLHTTSNALAVGQQFERLYDDATSRLLTLSYPGGSQQKTTYTYFPSNLKDRRLQTIENATGLATLSRFDYDYVADGQITNWMKLLGTASSGYWFEYNNANQLESARDAEDVNNATKKLDYDYDPVGNRISDANYNPNHLPTHGIYNSYAINALNQVSTKIPTGLTAGAPTTLIYDAVGNLADDGEGKTFEWDAANRLVAINYLTTGNRSEFVYDGLGRRVKIKEFELSAAAEIEPTSGNYAIFTAGPFTLSSGDYAITLQGINPSGGNNSALVDLVSLNNVLVPNGSFETPSGVSNSQVRPTGAAWSFTGDAGVAANGGTYTSGNPNTSYGNQVAFIENHGSISQTMSLANGTYILRLKAAQWSGNESSQRLRITFRSLASPATTKTFVWCGTKICEERDETGENVTKRFFAEGEQQISGGVTTNYFYTRDHLGSIREMTETTGDVVAQYDYDPYGNQIVLNGRINTDFGYTGHYYHAPSGLNLTMYRAYDPKLGRWLSRDPIGEEGGINLYGYVGNDPNNFVDPDGKFLVPALVAITVVSVAVIVWHHYKILSSTHEMADAEMRRNQACMNILTDMKNAKRHLQEAQRAAEDEQRTAEELAAELGGQAVAGPLHAPGLGH